ncbi:peptidoglycan DD-metalloendopeptidase family protein [Paraburkholderia sp. EB58]|uniref:peptidoglycan DD-metalloendopeptidase family protein n=1 Tax=Paraburkholderia sp. EB58 TaxID=3035125 RepID=UPI003D1C6729
MRSRFDKTMMASVAGVWVAVAMSGCVNVAQQGTQAGVAASGISAASSAATAGAASDAAASAVSLQASAAAAVAKAKKSPPLVYRVRRGDTLSHIAQHHHCSVKDLLAWNQLKPSTHLKRGQVLHVASPETVKEANAAAAAAAAAQAAAAQAAAAQAAAAQAAAAAKTAAAAVPASNAAAVSAATSAAANAAAGASATTATPSASTPSTASPAPSATETRQVDAEMSRHAKSVTLAWPAQGSVVQGFQSGQTRGIEIGGKPGDPVRAAADGKVMYAGTGLNEYGSLIIVQHNKDFLTAYSHNRKLLVKTGDIVRQGQEIAEMGDENNSRVSVLFEVRRDGKPVDPMPYLPGKQG